MISNLLSTPLPKVPTFGALSPTTNTSVLSPSISGGTIKPPVTTTPQPLSGFATTPTGGISPTTSGVLSTSTIDYTKHPEETIDQYNARIAKARSQTSGSSGTAGSTLSTNTGTQSSGLASQPTTPIPGLVPPPPVVPPPAQQQNQQQTPPPQDLSRSGFASGLMTATQGQDPYAKQIDDVNNQIAALRSSYAEKIGDTQQLGIPLEFKQGQGAALQTQEIGQENALTGKLNAYQATRGQNVSGLASGLNASAPFQQPYNSQMVTYDAQGNPVVQGGAGGNSLQTAVQGVVDKLKAGTMTYADAQTALAGYGQGGMNALQQALPQGFNISQSNTLAGQQGAIKPALDYARIAMQNLKTSFGGLGVPGQQSNIQPVADISNWFSNISGVGKEAVRTKEGALAEARSAIQKVLASVQGGTPTDYTGQSHALLPDNATPADVDAALSNLETLGTAKAGIYGNPGTSGTTGGSSIQAGGFSFTQDANGNWVPGK